MEPSVWPPPPSQEPPGQAAPSEAAPSSVRGVARLVGGVTGGIAVPAVAFWSGLLSFLIPTLERTIGCDKLEVCGQWYQPLYLLVGILLFAVVGAVLGGLAVSCLQRAVNPGK